MGRITEIAMEGNRVSHDVQEDSSSKQALDAVHGVTLKSQMDDPLRACVHCGFCLESCPTYQLSGDENNSPRGRLLLWRGVEEQRIEEDEWVDHYTKQCVGCLSCESVCPANVPYGHLLETTRRQQVESKRIRYNWKIRWATKLVQSPRLFQWLNLPIRLLRRLNLPVHPFLFPGSPSVVQTSRAYCQHMMQKLQPTGPQVALLTGCLMDAVFREINFATIDALIAANCRVVIPEEQTCCGALHEHTGMEGHSELAEQNRNAFESLSVEAVLTNSAGCGHSLQKSLAESDIPVEDVLQFLSRTERFQQAVSSQSNKGNQKLYVDLPCHLVHGQKVDGIPENLLDATGYSWSLAPNARDCCGSGGVYNVENPSNAKQILQNKAAFLDALPAEIEPIIVTANHVCMMQWNSAKSLVKRPFKVKHVVQLLT